MQERCFTTAKQSSYVAVEEEECEPVYRLPTIDDRSAAQRLHQKILERIKAVHVPALILL
jgi:hypothetical protein